jgi:hypothetical protein
MGLKPIAIIVKFATLFANTWDFKNLRASLRGTKQSPTYRHALPMCDCFVPRNDGW